MHFKFLLFLWIGLITSQRLHLFGEDNCAVIINELNTGSPENVKKSDFIELKLLCDSDNPKSLSLQGFKIVGMSFEKTSNSQRMSIDLVINLWNSKFNVNTKLFTIGTENVANTEMNTKSGYVTYRNKLTGSVQSLNMFLNKGSKNVHAIAILYKKDYAFPEIVLNAKNPILNIDDKMRDLIKTHLVDMIVYSRKAPYEQCDIFTKLCEEYLNKQYILREFDNTQMDRTLNRCSFDKNAFTPDKFKLGKATPGIENDCSGPNFMLQNHLSQLTDNLSNKPFDDDNIEENIAISEQIDSPQCSGSFDASTYEQLSDDLIEERIRKETQAAQENECSSLDLASGVGNVADELDRTNLRKRGLSETVDYSEKFDWDSEEHFQ